MFETPGTRYRVAIIYICTGRYVVLWPDFYTSAERHFLPGHEIHYYVFTDAEDLFGEANNLRVHRIPQDLEAWPYATLHRFAYMLNQEHELRDYDYIFFMNSNLEIVADIEPEMALPLPSLRQRLVVVQHPGYVARRRPEFPYETNSRSRACVGRAEGTIYACGGINGGTADAFLKLARELDQRINDDQRRGVIAVWHDESHLNRYIIGRRDVRVLSPSFCYPVGWDGNFPELIRLREKSSLIDEAVLKSWETPGAVNSVGKVRRLAGRAARRVVSLIGRAG